MTGITTDAGKSPLMSRNPFQTDAVARRACASGRFRLNHTCHVHTVSLRSPCKHFTSSGSVLSPAHLASPVPSRPSSRSPTAQDSCGVWDSAALSCRPPPPCLSGLPPRLLFLPTQHLHIPRAQLRCKPSPRFCKTLPGPSTTPHLSRMFSVPFLCPLYPPLTSHKPSIFPPNNRV